MATNRCSLRMMMATSLLVVAGLLFCEGYCTMHHEIVVNVLKDFSYLKGLETAMMRYLREIRHASTLLHFITDDAEFEPSFRNIIAGTCWKFRIPILHLVHNETVENSTEICSRYATCPKFRWVVALFKTPAAIKPGNWRMIYSEKWNPRAYFAIIITKLMEIQIVKQLLNNFWSVGCANVVLINLGSKPNNLKIYSFDPFITDGKTSGIVYPVNSKDLMFPDKMKNLQGHPIAVSLYRDKPHAMWKSAENFESSASGRDVQMLRYLSKRLNFTIKLRKRHVEASNHVIRLSTGENVGPIGDILNNRSEFLANSRYLEVVENYQNRLEFIYPFWRTYTIVIVQQALPSAFNYSPGGREDSFVGWFGGLALLIFLLYLRFTKKTSFSSAFLATLSLAIFQRLPEIGRTTFDRAISIILIYGSLVIISIYQGSLADRLTTPTSLSNIDTLQDLATNENLKLMVRPFEFRILNHSEAHETKKILAKHSIIELNFSACIGRMINSRNVACSSDRGHGKFAISQIRYHEIMSHNRHNRHSNKILGTKNHRIPSLHVIREGLVDFWKCYVLKRHSPYLDKFNYAISTAVEFGFFVKWQKNDDNKDFRELRRRKRPHAGTIKQMYQGFKILISGLVIATLIFCGEIILTRYRIIIIGNILRDQVNFFCSFLNK